MSNLEIGNTGIQNKKKEFFSYIEDEETKIKIKNYFYFISKQKQEYFEDNENWENKFLKDKKNFLLENTNFDHITFNTLLMSLIDRKKLVQNMEEQFKYDKLLSLPREVRIKFCTKAKVNIEDVMDWVVSSLTFDFKFGTEKINKEIYLNTTAGQLLPAEVQQVTKDWVVYFRSGQLWEFFTENNKRLTIHQDTSIAVSELKSRDEVLKQRENIKSELNIESEENLSTEDLIKLEAKLRWIDSEFALIAFKEKLENIPEEKRKSILENMLTEFDRIRWIYRFSWELNEEWKYNDRLALEIFSLYWWKEWKEKAKTYWIDEKYIEDRNSIIWTTIEMENIIYWEITQDLIDKISKIKKFRPLSKEAITLFTIACRIANIDESWAINPYLHKILSNESAWVVGILNYTIKWISMSEYKEKVLNSNKKNPIGSKSTASWLWQLLLSNIDQFYPNGRKWIWNPIEEAVGFIKYIEDRYWNPDIAMSVYWKKWSYIHSITWKQQYKWFKEWY